MDLRHLRYIVAAARNGSFSAAANEFNVRQPIVSKRIKEVEEELGVRLFERSTAGARLTLHSVFKLSGLSLRVKKTRQNKIQKRSF
jgi:DNA-binding transcriptional LysR family regulator